MDRFQRLIAYGIGAVLLCIGALWPLRAAHAFGIVPKAPQQTWTITRTSGWNAQCTSIPGPFTATTFAGVVAQVNASAKGCFALETRTVCTGPGGTAPCSQQTPVSVVDVSGYPWLSTGGAPYSWEIRARSTWADGQTTSNSRTGSATLTTATACPPNSADQGTNCICNEGFKPDGTGTQCVAQSCDAVLTSMQGFNWKWLGKSSSFCWQGCRMGTGVRGYSSVTNTSTTDGELLGVVGTCAGDPSTGNDSGAGQAFKCPTGQCPGQVNGLDVCQPCSETIEDTGGTEVDPGTETPTIPGAPAGTTKVTTQTSCTDTVCTTVTNYYNSGGSLLGSKSESEPKTNFCEDNPGAAICQATAWGGTCSGGFTCEGDAVQCAMAREQHQRWCQMIDGSSPLSELGAAAATGELVPPGHPGGAASSVSMEFSSVIDQTDRLGGGCPSDVSFGMGLSIPFSQLCGSLQLLGSLMVGLSMLAAAFIVFRQ